MVTIKTKKGTAVKFYCETYRRWRCGLLAGCNGVTCTVHINKNYGFEVQSGVKADRVAIMYESDLDRTLNNPLWDRIRYYDNRGYWYDKDT